MALRLDSLNPEQRDAVLHREGPLLILAGAGSGKTTTMAHRIAYLIAVGNLPATAILGLSFTHKAAMELRERVTGLVTRVSGRRSARGLTITTFHSLCVRMLRAHGHHLGFRPGFTVLDRSDQKDILRQTLRYVRIDDRKFDLDRILFEVGQAKSRFLNGDEASAFFLRQGAWAAGAGVRASSLPEEYGIATASAYPRYQDQLRILNAMDFDDLLFHGVALLERFEEVRACYNALYRQILVDEYQDTNPTQFRLLRLLTERRRNLCVVGDDDQSIYSWRGADPTHILEFSSHFPSARTITLDQNYRSTNTILEAANQLIRNNSKRHPKTLWSRRGSGSAILEVIVEDDRAEAEFVARELSRRAREESRPWKDFAVLYRSNAQSRIIEEALRRDAIPYRIVGGYSFLDLKEVKDVLAYWRLAVNFRDDASLLRVLNWPARGIGKSTVEALGNHAFAGRVSLFESLVEASSGVPRSAGGAREFRELIVGLREGLDGIPADPGALVGWARGALDRIGVRQAIDQEVEDPAQASRKWENVEELLRWLGQFRPDEATAAPELLPEFQHEFQPESRPEVGPAPDAARMPVSPSVALLQEFLNRMMLRAREEEGERIEDADAREKDEVTLLTLHGAKGLEYPVVFLIGMEEGFLPHQHLLDEATDLSEERRLCYVGITRARDHLVLTRARHRIRHGKPVPRHRSRFLGEVPASALITRDESHGPDATDSDEARKAHEEKVKGYLAGIRAMLGGS